MVDLHCHYPMHVLGDPPSARAGRRLGLRELAFRLAARAMNHPSFFDTWRVDLDGLEQGGVKVALSVLYHPYDELDLTAYSKPPKPQGFAALLEEIERVEDDLRQLDPQRRRHVVVRCADDLESALDSKRIAFLHCVEGGFHLGSSPDEVDRNVTRLADRGVIYVTLAHLFWRQVAVNVPCIPRVPERLYDKVFPQPPGVGLGDLGVAAVEAMYREKVLVDISHMRACAIDDTFSLLECLDKKAGAAATEFPVIATHCGMRLGSTSYNLTPEVVKRIADRDGIVGLMTSDRRMTDTVWPRTKTLDDTLRVLRRHLDALCKAAESDEHVGIGTDLDGFAKPTLAGIQKAADLRLLADRLRAGDPQRAQALLEGNALRILRRTLQAR
jgi:microsomal dipeptidase-like Zn-dependent dipeptidase